MHQPNLHNLSSKSKITHINLNIKILNKLARLSDVAKQRSRALNIVAKQRIELLNFLNTNKIGGFNA